MSSSRGNLQEPRKSRRESTPHNCRQPSRPSSKRRCVQSDANGREARRIFTLRLVGKPGHAGIHDLRALLKRLLRDGNLVCVDAREEHDSATRDQQPQLRNGSDSAPSR